MSESELKIKLQQFDKVLENVIRIKYNKTNYKNKEEKKC